MKILLCLFCILFFVKANESIPNGIIHKHQVVNRIKNQEVFFIRIPTYPIWNQNSVKVKTIVKINKGLFEYKYPELEYDKYNKHRTFVILSKEESSSLVFVEKLKKMGYTQVYYLKDADKTWNEIVRDFRGVKLFSMFSN